jgi:hypothetical protein
MFTAQIKSYDYDSKNKYQEFLQISSLFTYFITNTFFTDNNYFKNGFEYSLNDFEKFINYFSDIYKTFASKKENKKENNQINNNKENKDSMPMLYYIKTIIFFLKYNNILNHTNLKIQNLDKVMSNSKYNVVNYFIIRIKIGYK